MRWALSSAGRASRLHREGREFEPLSAHHLNSCRKAVFFCFKAQRLKLPREFVCIRYKLLHNKKGLDLIPNLFHNLSVSHQIGNS